MDTALIFTGEDPGDIPGINAEKKGSSTNDSEKVTDDFFVTGSNEEAKNLIVALKKILCRKIKYVRNVLFQWG